MPCSGLKSTHQVDAGRVVQHVDGAAAVPGAARMVGDQADTLPGELAKAVALEDIDTVQYLPGAGGKWRRENQQQAGEMFNHGILTLDNAR